MQNLQDTKSLLYQIVIQSLCQFSKFCMVNLNKFWSIGEIFSFEVFSYSLFLLRVQSILEEFWKFDYFLEVRWDYFSCFSYSETF
ncbi:hypothetical protein EGQ50_01220 [Coxiella endosymbiont of Amblyomma sculptum]|nr:hypothetical protein EGQ50_01220 [Coxiella endosymbiont of Amblyomma sculptum]